MAANSRNIMRAVIIVVLMMQVQQLLESQHVGGGVHCYEEYKVGDLNGWNIPSSANPNVYIQWSESRTFNVGDSLLFLYPPSQDSVIMVTQESYQSCNIQQQHIFLMKDDGNSIFNITCSGDFYFTSAVAGHCQSQQKVHISAAGTGTGTTCSFPPLSSSAAPSPLPLPPLMPPSSSPPTTLPMPSGSEFGSSSSSPSPSPSPFGNFPLQKETSSSSSSTALILIHASTVSMQLMVVIALFIFA